MQPGFELAPAQVLRGQKAPSGSYIFPPVGESVELPISGTLFLNITATHCAPFGNSHLPLPEGVVHKMHHYFVFRPRRTNLYSHFDRRNWATYLGMGDEPEGWAIAGMISFPFNLTASTLFLYMMPDFHDADLTRLQCHILLSILHCWARSNCNARRKVL